MISYQMYTLRYPTTEINPRSQLIDPTHEVPRINPKSKEICTPIEKNSEPKQSTF